MDDLTLCKRKILYMCRSLIVLIICIYLSFGCSTIKLNSVYSGEYFSGRSDVSGVDNIPAIIYDSISKKKIVNPLHLKNVVLTPVYYKVTLKLRKNGKFQLSYKDDGGLACSQARNSRFCSGNYKVDGDTLCLQSNYSVNDFHRIKYFNRTPQNQDSILLIVSAEHWRSIGCLLKGHYVNVETDYGLMKRLEITDSLYIDNQTKAIKISMDCPTSMDWYVDLKSKKKENVIKLNLLCGVDDENLSIDNMRFLIKNDTLVMQSELYFLDVEGEIFLKNNR